MVKEQVNPNREFGVPLPGELSLEHTLQNNELSDIRQRFEQTLGLLSSNPALMQGIQEATAKHLAEAAARGSFGASDSGRNALGVPRQSLEEAEAPDMIHSGGAGNQ